jgi:hypothetical protein
MNLHRAGADLRSDGVLNQTFEIKNRRAQPCGIFYSRQINQTDLTARHYRFSYTLPDINPDFLHTV